MSSTPAGAGPTIAGVSRAPARHRVFAALALLVSVAGIEGALRVAAGPSDRGSARLLNVDLVPIRLVSHADVHPMLDPSTPADAGDGSPATRGDLWGHFQLDPTLGYTYQPSTRSMHDWWQSNNVGARHRLDVEPEPSPGRRRILVFGESFAQGSRVRQEDAWPSLLNAGSGDRAEVLNFAVDGYSMAQSLLRFRQVRERLRYDMAALVFVPPIDLWRDVNTLRQLQNLQWDMPLMPRFMVDEGHLTLVPPLYADPYDLWRKNGVHPSDELRTHLRRVDRLYYRTKYEVPPIVGSLLSYRVFASLWWTAADRRMREHLMDPDSEAMRVSRAIFEDMQRSATADGARFALVVLPFQPLWWNGTATPNDDTRWRRMVTALCAPPIDCVDLLPRLRMLPAESVDRASDGQHFGPGMNREIAAALAAAWRLGTGQ